MKILSRSCNRITARGKQWIYKIYSVSSGQRFYQRRDVYLSHTFRACIGMSVLCQ